MPFSGRQSSYSDLPYRFTIVTHIDGTCKLVRLRKCIIRVRRAHRHVLCFEEVSMHNGIHRRTYSITGPEQRGPLSEVALTDGESRGHLVSGRFLFFNLPREPAHARSIFYTSLMFALALRTTGFTGLN